MSEEFKPQILTPAQQEKLSDWRALEEFLGIGKTPRPSAPTGVRCHNDACCGGQLPCPTKAACGVGS